MKLTNRITKGRFIAISGDHYRYQHEFKSDCPIMVV